MGINIIHNYFEVYCSEMTIEEFCKELANKGFLDTKAIRNAYIVRDFDEAYSRGEDKIVHIQMDLADRYGLSEHMIQNIIKHRAEHDKLNPAK